MSKVYRLLFAAVAALGFLLAADRSASAQYAYGVVGVQPAVVGYAPVRRGLFGRRIVYRPVVAPVVAPLVAPIIAPVPVAVAPPVFVAPVVPVSAYYAPPVRAYYRPVVPVTRYRVRYGAYYPAYGY